MKISKRITLIYLALIISATALTMIIACSSIECSIEGRVMCHYAIQDKNGTSATLALPLSVSFVRLEAGTDTTYINQQANVSTFDLPMSHIQDTDEMIVSLAVTKTELIDDTLETEVTEYLTDHVWITKTNTPLFESVDCAPRYNHTITSVRSTHNFIDTLIVNNETVKKNVSEPNILIRIRSIVQ